MPTNSTGAEAQPPAKRLRILSAKEKPTAGQEENVSTMTGKSKKQPNELSRKCPYLDTINKNVLDFDFEKLCSISLSKINVYACLVCGKYFQGRGINTHAYTHSVAVDHHVFLNLSTLRFYCLPDNYEIVDSSLGKLDLCCSKLFSVNSFPKSPICRRHHLCLATDLHCGKNSCP